MINIINEDGLDASHLVQLTCVMQEQSQCPETVTVSFVVVSIRTGTGVFIIFFSHKVKPQI